MPGPLDLYDGAQNLLDVCAEALDTLVGHGLDGAPLLQYVSSGLPAFDCEQLTVHASLIATSPNPVPGSEVKVGRVNLVTYTVMCARECAPTIDDSGASPTAEAQNQYAMQVLADGWAMWSAVLWCSRNNTLFPGGNCGMRMSEPSQPNDPSGGIGGWTLAYTTQLDGYQITAEIV